MPASSIFRRPALVLALGLCVVAAVTTFLGAIGGGPPTQAKPTPLSDVEGSVTYPVFSPDGNRLAYCQRGVSRDDTYHVFVRRVPKGAVTQLTSGEGNDISPAWSPDNSRVAFLRVDGRTAQLLSIPSAGGPETHIADLPAADSAQALPALSWSHDGRTLAAVIGGDKQPASIALVAVAGGSVRRVTTPAEGSDGDWCPLFSPDGSKLVFTRGPSVDALDLYAASADGSNPQRLTFEQNAIRGVTFASNGDLIYAAPRMGRVRLSRISLSGGSPREVRGAGFEVRFPAASPAGNRLVYTESPNVTSIWRGDVKSAKTDESDGPRPLIRSAGRERLAAYSPDGSRIADLSDQTGFDEIWISDSEGGNRVRVTNFAAATEHPDVGRPTWSPDGKWLLFERDSEHGEEIWKVPAAANSKPVRVLSGGQGAIWSHDGKSIYYFQRGQFWKASADGGSPEAITEGRGGNGTSSESPDGKFLYYHPRGGIIVRVSTQGGKEDVVVENDGPIIGDPVATTAGLYFLSGSRFDRTLTIVFCDLPTKKTSPVFTLPGREFGFRPVFSISPDGKHVLFARVDQNQTNLMLVENFK